MPIKFGDSKVSDRSRPHTIETAFKSYAAFAGIHDFSFDSLFVPVANGWTSDAGVTIAVVSASVGIWNVSGEWDDGVFAWG